MGLTRPTARQDRPTGCLDLAVGLPLGAAFLGLPATIAAGRVLEQASGSYEVDVLDDAALAFVAWFGFGLVAMVAWSVTKSRQVTATLVVVGAIAATALTSWLIRPQAPDGSAHAHSYWEEVGGVSADLTDWLDRTGRWRMTTDSHSPCVDQFGRERGAIYGGPSFEVAAVIGSEQFERLVGSVAGPGREIQADRFGIPAVYRGDQSERTIIRLEVHASEGRSTIEVVTPCLRSV
jgi:hypothetical protein